MASDFNENDLPPPVLVKIKEFRLAAAQLAGVCKEAGIPAKSGLVIRFADKVLVFGPMTTGVPGESELSFTL